MKEFDVVDSRPLMVKAKESKKSGFELPLTLGKPMPNSKEYDECMAMDSCIKNVFTGFRTDTMFSTMPMFVGYGMLSNVSQEALIRAGVETVADEMTRKFIRWTYHTDDGEDNKEDLLAKMDEQTKKYKLKEVFNEAMLKDGYFGGCLVYIDVGDLDDEEKEEPLILDKKTFKAGSLRGFKVIEPVNIYPGWYNTSDPTDEYYFKPKYWYILGKKYHESRFLYFAGNEAPLLLKPTYNFFGIPQAQLALDYVAHFVANREAAQELLNKFSLTCWKTNMTQALKGRGCNDLVSRVKMFNRLKNNNGTMVLDKETEDMLQINTPLGGVRDIVEMSLNLLTAVWRIPKIKYLGEGEGGLNASSKEQMRSFYDYILSQEEKEFMHPLEIVSKIFQLNLGLDINDAISFEFPPLVEMDDKERADLNKEQADRDAIYLANGVLSQEEVRKRLSMDKHSEYSMIDVDEMPEQPEPEPLENVDNEEENEEVKVANDELVMDDRWITVKKNHSNPEEKGRHLLLEGEGENQETPAEAMKRQWNVDLNKKDSEKKEKPERIKTTTEEYFELLDKEKNGKLTDSEKARKKELEEKEGFGEEPLPTGGYKKPNKHIQEFMKIKKEKQEAHKVLAEKEGEYKEKMKELRDASEEYKKASYEYDHAEEIAKERGIQEYMVLRDSSAIKRKLDLEFSQQAYKSIDGMFEARQKINNFEESSKAWSDGVNEIQSKIKDRIVEVSKENEKLADSIVGIENKIPEYKETLSSLWKDYKEKTKDSDWASSSFAYGDYMNKAQSVKQKIIEEKQNFAKRVGDVLRNKDGQSVGFSKSGIAGLEDKFKSVFDGVMAKGMLDENEKPEVVKRKCRAHQSGKTLTLSGDTDIQTTIHEFMHYVEEKNPQMLANSVAFLRYRTGDEKITSLKKLTGISYGTKEKARADKFFDAYCGKIYSFTDDYLNSTATEIMSMGVQELFTNPAKFRKDDPEYFNFVIANLKGTL